MSKKLRLAIYSIFFLSGLVGLLYEIVWGRQLVLIFGNTTHSLVAVLAAFFTGLALGSFIIGKIIDRIPDHYLFKVYAACELGVGVLSGVTLLVFPAMKALYATLSDGTSTSFSLLLIKFALTTLAITLPTFCMGATLPILTRALRGVGQYDQTISRLYAINTFGGVTGVFLTGFIFIELLGLTSSVLLGIGINCLIAFTALLLPQVKGNKAEKASKKLLQTTTPHKFINFTLFCSGFIAIAYQIMWTRLLIPSLGTLTYAFSAMLICNLFGIAIGSTLYKRCSGVITGKYLLVGLCQLGISLFATLPIILTHFSTVSISEVIIRVFPPTLCMGIAFPALINIVKETKNIGNAVGRSYAYNTLGSIIGSFATSFILIPFLGTTTSIVLLAGGSLLFTYFFLSKETTYPPQVVRHFRVLTTVSGLGILMLFFFVQQHQLEPKIITDFQRAAKENKAAFKIKEDEVASVMGYNDGHIETLLIDGYPTTSDTFETRVMAHLPIALYGKPKRVLIICFGMGTSFRSFLKHDLSVDAVELVPSVPTFMSLFHKDAQKWQTSPMGKIIINDGRNYAFLTHKKYDLVIIDPPPPFSTAGSSVLYTEEFYQDLKKLLTSKGIVSQWLYYENTRNDDALMAVKSFTNSFSSVAVFRLENSAPGIFLEGSQTTFNPSRISNLYKDPIAKADIAELLKKTGALEPKVQLLATKSQLLPLVQNISPITDDRPGNEYFLIRHLFSHPEIIDHKSVQNLFLRP